MKYHLLLLFLANLMGNCGSPNPRILMQTELGDITFEVYLEKAPVTATNFLKYGCGEEYPPLASGGAVPGSDSKNR